MLLLAKSEDIADSLSSLTQGRKMLVFSYPLWKDNMPSNSRHIASYTCSIVTIALSRTEILFFQQMTLI